MFTELLLVLAVFLFGEIVPANQDEPPTKKRKLNKKSRNGRTYRIRRNRAKLQKEILQERQERFDANYAWYLKGCQDGKTTLRSEPKGVVQKCFFSLFSTSEKFRDQIHFSGTMAVCQRALIRDLNDDAQHRDHEPQEPVLDDEWLQEIREIMDQEVEDEAGALEKGTKIAAIRQRHSEIAFQAIGHYEAAVEEEKERGKTFAWLLAPEFGNVEFDFEVPQPPQEDDMELDEIQENWDDD